MIELNNIYKGDCQTELSKIADGTVDCILTDPPYLYLKGQKLDRDFDEDLFFSEAKRVLKPDGFIILFGRGTSFYRWNTKLAALGFSFKEEIVWNKRRISSPALALGRVHETISIHCKGKGSIKKSVINYGELKGYNIDKIYEDLKRLGGLFNKGKAYEKVIENLKKIEAGQDYSTAKNEVGKGFKHTFSSSTVNRCVSTYTIDAIEKGCREQSIIDDADVHYANIHPTQKPVRLLERLLALTTEPGQIILDPFSGSGSTAAAAINSQRKFIGFELDEEYYTKSVERIKELKRQFSLFG